MNKLSHVKKTAVSYLMVVITMLMAQGAMAAVDEEVIQKYIKVFSGSSLGLQKSACNKLQWAGISDTRVFDLIEKSLLNSYSLKSKARSDHSAWMAKALSFSGQEKYRTTLEKVADTAGHNGVRKHAKNSLKNISKYKKWNPIISDTRQNNPSVSTNLNQYANMFRSGDRELQAIAAKRVNFEQLFTNNFILKIIDSEVKKGYTLDQSEKIFVEAMAHMTKMLAASGKEKYRSTAQAVANDALNSKLRKYAATYLKKY